MLGVLGGVGSVVSALDTAFAQLPSLISAWISSFTSGLVVVGCDVASVVVGDDGAGGELLLSLRSASNGSAGMTSLEESSSVELVSLSKTHSHHLLLT